MRQVRIKMSKRGFIAFVLLFIQAHTVSLNAAAQPGDGRGTAVNEAVSRKFKTTFVSLSPGHAIASSFFIFTGQDTFEIETPGEDYRERSGSYRRDNLLFEAGFKATILKENKQYLYAFSAKGILLFGSYIAGMVVVEEAIKETKQNQKVTFLFTGTAHESSPAAEEKESLFPF